VPDQISCWGEGHVLTSSFIRGLGDSLTDVNSPPAGFPSSHGSKGGMPNAEGLAEASPHGFLECHLVWVCVTVLCYHNYAQGSLAWESPL
jgi:hypothetical protein